ncbi:unnamed protein product [Orchesella dallaii]|uniref:Cullin-associated NEDD8-dissociated protein 1 n=1 Tax=Orchesella dallaii TaxID=48710 RepID=A0ABP1S584_9HEXA
MSTVSFHIANLLEKMTSSDKDFRFMATNDLMSELQKDSIKLDDDSERKVVRMLLKLLEDKNGEVQNLAVKCLGPLVAKVKEPQVETIVDTLCTNMTGDREQLRDISSIGLKTVITELPLTSQQLATVICKKIIGKLTVAIARQEDVTVQLEALDILGDLLSRFGPILQQYHAMLLDALLPQLNSQRQAVRKRTVVALGHLAASCGAAHYQKMVGILVEEMQKGIKTGHANTYIQCCATVCKNAGQRFADYLDQVVNMLMEACQKSEEDELKENTLQALEVFVTRCPQEMGTLGHLESVLQLCVKLISHDPNYNDDEGSGFHPLNEESMDTTTGDEDDDQNDDDEQEEDEYSDDDDMSWKVRRAAAKCIEAVIVSRPDMLLYIYQTVSVMLIVRFREREENVRCDVFSAYRALLRMTKPAVQALNESRHTGLPPSPEAAAAVQALDSQIPQLVKIVQKQLKEKNIKSRQVALQLLSDVVGVLPGCLAPFLTNMMNGILVCLSDKNSTSNVRTNTLTFVYCIMSSHPIEVVQPHVEVLLPALLTCAGDNFYKVTAEALLALQVLVKVVRSENATEHANAASIAQQIYPIVLRRLKATDIDQEVKETAITTMATLLAHLGAFIQPEWGVCIPIFLERLKNEITRLTAVKALNLMASSQLVNLDLTSVLGEAITVLASFLRKNQRALKLATLNLLDTLMKRYSLIESGMLQSVIAELPPLLSEGDLHCAQQALQLMTSIAVYQPRALEQAAGVCMPAIKVLVRSPLMQGAALGALMEFLRALVKANIPGYSSNRLLSIFLEPDSVVSPSKAETNAGVHHKQSFYSLAKCISVISVSSGPHEALSVANSFVSELSKGPGLQDTQVVIALLSIGEIGRHVDLSQLGRLREEILQCFSSPSEEIKTAAAYAFGSVAIGNLPTFLPALLQEMAQQPKKQYLLLHALKEIISAQQNVNISMWTEDIWSALFAHAECPEEGTRNVVAECLGRLTLATPEKFLPRLKEALASDSNLLRTTVVTAVKFTIVDQPQPIDPLLKENIGDFLLSLADPDINVRRVALVAFNSAAHNKPALIRDLLPELLPKLYVETQVRKELIREVEMGPFKHSVDDGLDLRKAAFECMYTLLDSCLDRLEIRDFLTHVENGLRDHYDIKMLTYLMVARLASLCPSQVIQRLDRLIEPLKNTVTMKVKANSVKQEYEKQDELKRAALRAVSALSSIPDADKHIQLMEFVAHIRNSQELQALYESVQSDTNSGASNDVPMNIE